MGSDENKPQLRMSLELNQERQPKKKGLWQRVKMFIINWLEKRASGEWKGRDWGNW